jgi:glycosyltransferase involved in cell wall biosynthesis
MRVLQVAARGATLAQFVLPLMVRLRAEGASVEALCGDDGFAGRLTDQGFEVHIAPMGHTLSPVAWLNARRLIARFLASYPYDLVHTHGSFAGIALNDIVLSRVPTLVYTQHGFYIHEGLGPLRRRLWLGIEKRGLRYAHRVICVSQAERDLALTLGVGGPGKNASAVHIGPPPVHRSPATVHI